jgi:indolepyruvate ferredoxin oxidoreductase beta subunit
MHNSINFLLVGVGGQGILTASDIVAEVGLAIGLDAKKSEVHGFSQRGGVVESHVRWGPSVAAPIAEKGTIDVLLAFETMEAARWIDWLKPWGTILVNRQQIVPMSVSAGEASYPAGEAIEAVLRAQTGDVTFVEGLTIAERLGNPRLANTALLGALSARLARSPLGAKSPPGAKSLQGEIDPAVWLEVIERRVPPRYVELNRMAFWEGRKKLPVRS